MLIISVLLSRVNWIQTVTIVWSENSLFLWGLVNICHGAWLEIAQLSKKFFNVKHVLKNKNKRGKCHLHLLCLGQALQIAFYA